MFFQTVYYTLIMVDYSDGRYYSNDRFLIRTMTINQISDDFNTAACRYLGFSVCMLYYIGTYLYL